MNHVKNLYYRFKNGKIKSEPEIANQMEVNVLPTLLYHLRFHQLWPLTKSGKNQLSSWFYVKYLLTVLVYYMVTIIGQMIYIYRMIEVGEVSAVMEDIAYLATMIGTTGLVFGFISRVKYLVKLTIDFTLFNKNEATVAMKKLMAKYDFTTKIFAYYAFFGFVGMIPLNVGLKFTCHLAFVDEERRLNASKGIGCGMLLNQYVPFDYDYFPVKQIITFVQLFTCIMLVKGAQMISVGPLECIQHICLKFQHLKLLLTNVIHNNDDDPIVKQEKLTQCIAYHNHIIDMAELLNKAFSHSMLIHVSVTAIILGIAEFVFITQKSLGVLIHVVGWLSLIFPPCYGGFKLMIESTSISEHIYNEILWHEEDTRVQKYLMLMMVRSQKPLVLYSGPFGVMSLELFLMALKTSYSFLALLKNTSH